MAHYQQDLIELYARADRVCEETHQVIQVTRYRLETSMGWLAEHMAHSVDTRDLVARSKALLERSARLRTL